MSLNTIFAIGSAVVVATGLMLSDAAAGSSARHGKDRAGRTVVHVLHSPAAGHRRHFARRAVPEGDGYGRMNYRGEPNVGAYHGPGYIFVPGEGILGESCNMPTSTCPNTERDVQ